MSFDSQKVLFAHDGRLFFDNKGNYYGTHVNDSIFDRYLNLGNSLSLLLRTRPITDTEMNKIPEITNPYCSVISVPNFKSMSKFLKNRKEAKQIISEAVKKSDVVIARIPSAIGSYAVEFANKFHKPVLAEVVACNWDSFWYYNYKGKLLAPYFYWKQKKLMKKINHAIYVTKDFLQNRYPSNGKSIGCSDVALKTIDDKILGQRLQKIGGQTEPLKLGTVAALSVPYKSQQDVIKAIAGLKRKGHRFTYYLVGNGNDRRLRTLTTKLGLENEVVFVGTLKHDDVFEFLDDIDIYIHPSKQEGLPRAMVEALSRALPTLGANTAGIPELLDKKDIFEKGNRKQIAEMLKKMNKEKMKKQAKRNFATAKNYARGKLNQKRLNFYHEFLEDHNLNIPDSLKSQVNTFETATR